MSRIVRREGGREAKIFGVFAFEETLISSALRAKYNSHRVSNGLHAMRHIHASGI